MRLTSPAFEHGGTIPERFTCDGADVSPALAIEDVPHGAGSLALIMDDPDAPSGNFTHWLLWDLPATTRSLPEAVPTDRSLAHLGGAVQGRNDFGNIGYGGPCPPRGRHRYRLRLVALSGQLGLGPGSDRRDLEDAMRDATVAEAELHATYARRAPAATHAD